MSEESIKDRWMTPIDIIQRAWGCLEHIDLDPASSAAANERVKATRFFDRETNGLDQEWSGRVWLNPPFSNPAVKDFTAKFIQSDIEGLLLCNFDNSTARCQSLMWECAFCLVSYRINFIHPETGTQAKGNRFSQAIFYKGPNVSRFHEHFEQLGPIFGDI